MEMIRLRPRLRQCVMDNIKLLPLSLLGFIYSGLEGMPCSGVVFVASLLLTLYIIYCIVRLRVITNTITDEQLILSYGVFTREQHYLELYRIVDFRVSRSLLQRIFGLKSVIIYSTDKTIPALCITGIDDEVELVAELRRLVEYNRKRMGIYEMTNR